MSEMLKYTQCTRNISQVTHNTCIQYQ